MKHYTTTKKGFTLIELLVVMSIIALLLSILMPALGRARKEAMLVQDSTQVSALQKGFQIYTTSNNGRYPIPGLEARLSDIKGRGDENLEENDHAAVLSLAIMQELFTVDNLIAPTEAADTVFQIDYYDFDGFEPNGSQGNWNLWDDSFVNDLDVASNNSYGIMPVSGKRKRYNWCASSHSPTTFAVVGTRGPELGEEDKFSKGYQMHGIDREWMGPIAFGDGHTETLKTFAPSSSTYIATSGPEQDNIFLEEEDQEDNDYMPGGLELGQGADVVLTHIKGGSEGDQGAEGDANDQGKGGGANAFTHD